MDDARRLINLGRQAVLDLEQRPTADGVTRRVLARDSNSMVLRASVPPDEWMPPHGVPRGLVTILLLLSGSMELALGNEFREEDLEPVEAGGMVVFRPDDPPHFGRSGPDGAEYLAISVAPEAVRGEFAALLDAPGGRR